LAADDVTAIGFGCCVGDWGRFERNVAPRLEGRQVMALGGQRSIAVAYNRILDWAIGARLDALVLAHDDLQIVDINIETAVLDAVARFAVAGVVGASQECADLAWWNYGLIGLQNTDSGQVGPATGFGQATAVDGSIMLLSRWAMRSVRFDTQYLGFHGYDVDYCRQVRDLGRQVGVVELATHHHTTLGWKSPEVLTSWAEADRHYRRRWATVLHA
jgi:GT2 family glycosyltransferase